MDLRWLTAEEQELEAAIEQLDEDSQPQVKGRSAVLAGIAFVLLIVYIALVWMVFGESIDAEARPRVEPGAVGALLLNMGIFAVLWYAATRFHKWLRRPRRDAQLRAWREHMTGVVNDVDIEPIGRATFVSLITGERRTAACRPRFTAPGVEFGNLTSRTHSALEWHYLSTQLPAPLPHVILESTTAGPLPNELFRADDDQVVPMGYPFDRSFVLHAPRGYERDALYVLTPAVMAALLDHATDFHIEIIGDTLVFFAPGHADFGRPEPWQAIDALWMNAVPALVARAQRYRDERVPKQSFDQRLLSFQEALSTPGHSWETGDRRIGPDGKRLARQKGPRWSMLRKYGGEYLLGWLVLGPVFVALFAFGSAVVKLFNAFFG